MKKNKQTNGKYEKGIKTLWKTFFRMDWKNSSTTHRVILKLSDIIFCIYQHQKIKTIIPEIQNVLKAL